MKLLSGDAGAVVNGELLSSLPPSVLAVLEGDRSGGSFNALSSATLGEWELPTEHAVSGVRTLTFSIARTDAPRATPTYGSYPGSCSSQRPGALDRRAAARRRPCGVALAAAVLHASTPKFFQAATQADFLKGDLDSLSIDSRGQLTHRRGERARLRDAAPFLWSMAPGPDGSLFVGTGNEGKVFRIDNAGKGSVFYDAAELSPRRRTP